MPDELVFRVDTRKAMELANRAKNQAARAYRAIEEANTELAMQVQKAEARKLRKEVAETGRPQRHKGTQGGLASLLEDERNRHVDVTGFQVNDTDFLDREARYWRQLEVGFQGRKQFAHGLFLEYGGGSGRRKVGIFTRPSRDSRAAYKFVAWDQRGLRDPGADVMLAIGPRRAYNYLGSTVDDFRARWAKGRGPNTVYRRAFAANGLDLLAQFKSAHGRGLRSFGDLSE